MIPALLSMETKVIILDDQNLETSLIIKMLTTLSAHTVLNRMQWNGILLQYSAAIIGIDTQVKLGLLF